jgi:hypothetical protein
VEFRVQAQGVGGQGLGSKIYGLGFRITNLSLRI